LAEAKLTRGEHGLAPEGEGWFVLNARDAVWWHSDGLGLYCPFEGEEARFSELGINLNVLPPGEPSCMYHGEAAQEDFLVLSGECILVIDGEERSLKAWDFVHCPPWTAHVFVGAGDGPCLLLAVGARGRRGIRYPVSDVAQRHGAGVDEETDSPKEAYARFARPQVGPPPDLPG
jgi:uncharacterized cupin superfamily protein